MPPGKLSIEELRGKLTAPLPAEAIRPDPRNPKLSAINPAFILERLNEVFGEGGWTERYTVIEAHPDARMIVVKCDFSVPKLKIFRQAFGGNANEDRGDAFKGACTDALTKCASKLGIANQVFKGEYDVQVKHQAKAERDATYEKRILLQRPITAFQIKQFLIAVRETKKTGVEVNTYFRKLGISDVAQMQRGQFNEAIRWARKPTDLEAGLKASVEFAKPPAPAITAEDEADEQGRIPLPF